MFYGVKLKFKLKTNLYCAIQSADSEMYRLLLVLQVRLVISKMTYNVLNGTLKPTVTVTLSIALPWKIRPCPYHWIRV